MWNYKSGSQLRLENRLAVLPDLGYMHGKTPTKQALTKWRQSFKWRPSECLSKAALTTMLVKRWVVGAESLTVYFRAAWQAYNLLICPFYISHLYVLYVKIFLNFLRIVLVGLRTLRSNTCSFLLHLVGTKDVPKCQIPYH